MLKMNEMTFSCNAFYTVKITIQGLRLIDDFNNIIFQYDFRLLTIGLEIVLSNTEKKHVQHRKTDNFPRILK